MNAAGSSLLVQDITEVLAPPPPLAGYGSALPDGGDHFPKKTNQRSKGFWRNFTFQETPANGIESRMRSDDPPFLLEAPRFLRMGEPMIICERGVPPNSREYLGAIHINAGVHRSAMVPSNPTDAPKTEAWDIMISKKKRQKRTNEPH